MGPWFKCLSMSVLSLMVCTGCKHKSSDPLVSQIHEKQVTTKDAPVFEILDQGASPLSKLRYRLSAMKPQSMKIVMDMTVGAQAGDSDVQAPEDLPPISMIISIEPSPIDTQGLLPYEFKVISTKILGDQDDDSSMTDGMKAELDRLQGLSGSAQVSAQGLTSEVKIHLPGDKSSDDRNELLNRMREEIAQMSIPFPDVLLGQGAKWKVVRSVKSGTIKMQQVSTYTIEKLKDTSVKINVDMEQNAKPQALDSSTLAGASARLVSLHSDGGGSSLIDFSKLVPEANAYSHTNAVMELRARGNQQRVTTTLDLKMTMSPASQGEKK